MHLEQKNDWFKIRTKKIIISEKNVKISQAVSGKYYTSIFG